MQLRRRLARGGGMEVFASVQRSKDKDAHDNVLLLICEVQRPNHRYGQGEYEYAKSQVHGEIRHWKAAATGFLEDWSTAGGMYQIADKFVNSLFTIGVKLIPN